MIMKIVAVLSAGFIGSEIAWQLWKNIYQQRLRTLKKKAIAEVLLFSNESSNCRDHFNSMIECSKKCPIACIKRIIHYMDKSTKTLDILIYLMTTKSITDAILRAHKRNVSIRVIMDGSMSENSACGARINFLRKSGIPIAVINSTTSLMHHKIAIIDGKIMIYGSTNWTMQGFFGNFDGIIITNQLELINPIRQEFDRMWRTIQPLGDQHKTRSPGGKQENGDYREISKD